MLQLISTLSRLEQSPVLDTFTKELVGINTPRAILTRSNDERRDVVALSVANMAGAFGLGLGLDKLMKKVFAKAAEAGENAVLWKNLGSSLAIYSGVFAVMMSAPFIRNYYTAKKTGKTDYAAVINNQTPHAQTDTDKQRLNTMLNGYRSKALTILGGGATAILLAVAGTKLGIGRNINIGKLAPMIRKWGLKDGSFKDFQGLRAVLFWGVPSYIGAIMASRDPFEIKEQILKFGAFVFSFLGPQYVMDKFYKGKFENLLGKGIAASHENIMKNLTGPAQKTALRHWVTRNTIGFLSSLVLLGTLPSVLNIYLTKKRLKTTEKTGDTNSPVQFAQANNFSVPRGQLQRKNFQYWAKPG